MIAARITSVASSKPAEIAMRRKNLGIWEKYTWKESYERVKYFSLGLISLGLEPRDRVAIIGDNAPEWFWAALATMSARGAAGGFGG